MMYVYKAYIHHTLHYIMVDIMDSIWIGFQIIEENAYIRILRTSNPDKIEAAIDSVYGGGGYGFETRIPEVCHGAGHMMERLLSDMRWKKFAGVALNRKCEGMWVIEGAEDPEAFYEDAFVSYVRDKIRSYRVDNGDTHQLEGRDPANLMDVLDDPKAFKDSAEGLMRTDKMPYESTPVFRLSGALRVRRKKRVMRDDATCEEAEEEDSGVHYVVTREHLQALAYAVWTSPHNDELEKKRMEVRWGMLHPQSTKLNGGVVDEDYEQRRASVDDSYYERRRGAEFGWFTPRTEEIPVVPVPAGTVSACPFYGGFIVPGPTLTMKQACEVLSSLMSRLVVTEELNKKILDVWIHAHEINSADVQPYNVSKFHFQEFPFDEGGQGFKNIKNMPSPPHDVDIVSEHELISPAGPPLIRRVEADADAADIRNNVIDLIYVNDLNGNIKTREILAHRFGTIIDLDQLPEFRRVSRLERKGDENIQSLKLLLGLLDDLKYDPRTLECFRGILDGILGSVHAPDAAAEAEATTKPVKTDTILNESDDKDEETVQYNLTLVYTIVYKNNTEESSATDVIDNIYKYLCANMNRLDVSRSRIPRDLTKIGVVKVRKAKGVFYKISHPPGSDERGTTRVDPSTVLLPTLFPDRT